MRRSRSRRRRSPSARTAPNGVTKIGLFVKHDGAGPATNVAFDNFVVEAESCGETGDTTPPTTTHVLDPAEPDGEEDWYVTPVEVTLNATDNEGGSGVDVTEYRFAGEEEWTTYTGPFTVDDEGSHTIQYRSTDNEGNTETPKSVSVKVDATDADDHGAAQRRAAGVQLRRPGRGRPECRRRRRVGRPADRDPRRRRRVGSPTSRRRSILNSAADLERWEQAGPGGLNWMDTRRAASPAPPAAWACRGTRSRTSATSR